GRPRARRLRARDRARAPRRAVRVVRAIQGANPTRDLELLRSVAAAAAQPVSRPDDRPLRSRVLRCRAPVRWITAAIWTGRGAVQRSAMESQRSVPQPFRQL